jgi:hypothetical protein
MFSISLHLLLKNELSCFLKKTVISFALLLVFIFWLPFVHAQAVVGKTYKEFLPLGSGTSVALPEGSWQSTHVTNWSTTQTDWEIFTLKNLQPNPAVAFLIVRRATRPYKWGNTSCAQKNSSNFYLNEHGTLQSATLNKCSLYWSTANIEQMLDLPNWNVSQASKDWWSHALPGLQDLSKYANLPMLISELDVRQYNSYRIRVEAFIPAPKGFSLRKFRDDLVGGIARPETEMLSVWNSIYIESIFKSFFEKKPQGIMALAVPWTGTNGKTLSQPDAVMASAKPSPAVTAPSPTPASAPASIPAPSQTGPSATETDGKRQAEQERKKFEDEKNNMAQQLETMRQMLAKLQKENEAATAKANSAATNLTVAKAEPVVPAKQVIYANRKALVIGNDLYTDVPKLNNAGADANAMAIALEQVGYKVYKHLNLDEKKFKQAIRDFRTNVQGGDEVLVFYAGHGVQLGSANYLLPIDIKGEQEDQVKDEAILLQKILDELEEKKTKFALAVIDACRDNPFKTKGRALGGRGLAPTSAATGQMVMFSAGSGQQALDRLGDNDKEKNGLFTRIFVKEMMKPGVSVDRVLRNVRTEVVRLAKSVGHEQTPALYDQAIGEFYFKQ